MKYLKRFNTTSEYESYVNSNNFILPNVSSIKVTTDKKVVYKKDKYLTFTAEQANSTIQFSKNDPQNLLNDVNLKYSIDNGITWNGYTINEIITLSNIGDSVKFRGNNVSFGSEVSNYYKFSMTGKIKASGDITSLLNNIGGNVPLNDYCFQYLFNGCKSLTQAPNLPSKSLAQRCYYRMFFGCSSLIQAPNLPATILARNCYSDMFFGCSSLTQAPNLPATILAQNCYSYMFGGCSSLTQAPNLPATTLAWGCYLGMFSECTSLVIAPNLPATTLTEDCYDSMFSNCISLVIAPDLPATTLVRNCYYNMFSDCFSLTTVNAIINNVAEYCCFRMFTGCTSLITPPILNATTLAQNCYQEMFKDCTSLVTAPDLPATELVDCCYYEMFYGCSSLSSIKALFISISQSVIMPLDNWLYNAGSNGIFYKHPNANYINSELGLPKKWTIQTAAA